MPGSKKLKNNREMQSALGGCRGSGEPVLSSSKDVPQPLKSPKTGGFRGLTNNASAPSEEANDFVGYEVLIDFISKHKLQKLEGDIIEIGAFMGGGTAKLAKFAVKYGKKVYAIDIFDPRRDKTPDKNGVKMCDIYEAFLQGRSQLEVYQQATNGFDNIVTINKDSKRVRFPRGQKFVLGFIDGNHQADYVINDFNLIWRNLAPGGSVGFHDYNFDLPEVTEAIDGLIYKHRIEISEIHEIKQSHIVILTKRKGLPGK